MSASPIVLPDMPAVEGLCFRSIHGEADAYALYGVHAGRATRDGIDPLSPFEECLSRESIRLALAKAVATWQHDQWLVSQVGEHVIGYSRINSWCEEDGRWVYLISGYVLPEWRGRGIGTAMLHWGEQTARRLAASQHPNEKFEFAANASSTEQDATALLLHDGYCLGYTMLDMRLDASTPLSVYALPPGLEVRLVLPEHLPLVVTSIIEAYQYEYADHRFQEVSDPVEYAGSLSAPPHDPALWQVAWEGQQVAGQVLPLIENGKAQIYEVSVRPAWRRKGLARALLSRALQSLRERDVEIIWIGTVAEFPTRACDLYRSMGFRVSKEVRQYRMLCISCS